MQGTLATRKFIIKLYLTDFLVFYFSCFHATKEALKKMEGLLKRFLWSGKLSKINWSKITLPKATWGMSISDLKELADRLAVEWLIKALRQRDEPWASLLLLNVKHMYLLVVLSGQGLLS